MQKRALVCLRILSIKCVYKSYIYLIYMYEQDMALNNLQWLICHKTEPNQTTAEIMRKENRNFGFFQMIKSI